MSFAVLCCRNHLATIEHIQLTINTDSETETVGLWNFKWQKCCLPWIWRLGQNYNCQEGGQWVSPADLLNRMRNRLWNYLLRPTAISSLLTPCLVCFWIYNFNQFYTRLQQCQPSTFLPVDHFHNFPVSPKCLKWELSRQFVSLLWAPLYPCFLGRVENNSFLGGILISIRSRCR